jgi:murein L,D-transpeptidase YcbB/YkuD
MDAILTGVPGLYKKCSIFIGFLLIGAQLAPLSAAETMPPSAEGLASNCPELFSNFSNEEQLRLQAFYQQRGSHAAWASPVQLERLASQLEQLADDGLNPDNYQLQHIRQLVSQPAAAGAQADCRDMLVSQAYLQALHDLSRGRLQQGKIEPLWHSELTPAPSAMPTLSQSQLTLADLGQAFNEARPSSSQYRQLRLSYARVRQSELPNWPKIASGPLLKAGMQDPRIPALDERLVSEGYLPASAVNPDDTQYNSQRVAAMEKFQRRHGLQADGIIGAGTLAELNVSAAQRRDQLRINLERWRWISPDIEAESLLVDIDGGYLSYYRDRALVWKTRTQVGRAQRQTPSLKSMLTRLTLNPTWTVPPTILKKDKLPAIRADSNFLAEHQLRVLDFEGNELDPADIDWQRPGGIMLRQDAGPNNPLGQMALRFPNPFSVYLHDTPSQALFAKAPRTFSSGCVRVEDVYQVLDMLLTPAEKQRVDELLASGRTFEYKLPRRVPIIMAYWTAEADDKGQPLYRPDIYGHDERLVAALNAATR